MPNKSRNPESLEKNHSSWKGLQLICTKLLRICLGCTTSCFVFWFVFQVTIEKTICTRILQGNWERFLYEKDRNYNYCKLSCKFTFTHFLFFQRNQKQESYFQQVGGLVTRNSFAIYLQGVALYLKGMPNSVDFYKRTCCSCSYYSSMIKAILLLCIRTVSLL